MVALKVLLILAGALIAISAAGLACRRDVADRGVKAVALLALGLAVAVGLYLMRSI